MRLLTSDQCDVWLGKRGIERYAFDLPSFSMQTAPIEDRGCVRAMYASYTAKKLFAGRDCLIVVNPDPVRETCQVPCLFERIRSHDSLKSILAFPGTATQGDETEILTALIAVSLFLYWDFFVLDSSGSRMLICSHDNDFAAGRLFRKNGLKLANTVLRGKASVKE